MTTKTKTTTAPINLGNLNTVETTQYAAWGATTHNRAKLTRAAEETQSAGLQWPEVVARTVDTAAEALRTSHTALTTERHRLGWEDLQAPDLAQRIRTAALDDSTAAMDTRNVRAEVNHAAYSETLRVFIDSAPEVLKALNARIVESSEDRALVGAASLLPKSLQHRVSRWAALSTAHAEVLRLTDLAEYEDLERNSGAHRLHRWTQEQWLEFHTAHDTLARTKNPDWIKWATDEGIEIAPVGSVRELAQRTKAANDIGQEYNRVHRRDSF